MDKKKLKIILKFLLLISIIVFFVLAFRFVFKKYGFDSEYLEKILESTGIWAEVVFVLICFLQVTFIPIPSSIAIVSGSLLFGGLKTFILSFIGIFLGSLLAFYLGRKIGIKFVYWAVGDKESVDNYLKKLKGKESIALFFMFLFPFFPDDALCSIAGITSMKLKTFIIIQVITRIIGIGGNIFFLSGEIIPYNPFGITLLVILGICMVIAFIICYKNGDKIKDKFFTFIDKIKYKGK